MKNVITHLVTPSRLILAWQAPEERKERYRFAVGEVLRDGSNVRLRYFPADEFRSCNNGHELSRARELGFQGYPGFPLSKSEHVEGVQVALMRRVPPQGRSDFPAYRMQFRLAPDLPLTDFDLLAATEAKLPSDGFSVVDPYEDSPALEWRDLMFEIAGYRYYVGKLSSPVAVGDELKVIADPDNPVDAGAVQLLRSGECVGYVNRLQAPAFLRWLRNSQLSSEVERLNGSADRPRAYAFVRVRPSCTAAAA